MDKYRILVVDDEEDICAILKYNLENAGYYVETVTSAESALAKCIKDFDLLLLDVMLTGISGFEMAERLKSDPDTAGIPIIFVTAKDTEDDTLSGFNIGADDYISKPFSVKEVVSRVKAVLRRSSSASSAPLSNVLVFNTLKLYLDKKYVTVDDEEVNLTKIEFEILHLLLANKGVVFSREDILSKVWMDGVLVLDRTVDVNITRLRRKIKRYGDNIVTRHGFGYCFKEV